MVLYTNYKQMAKIILKSEDVDEAHIEYSAKNVAIGHIATSKTGKFADIIKKYTFNVNLPFTQYGKNTRLAVDTLASILPHSDNLTHYKYTLVPDIYLKNIHKKNVYHSANKSGNGTCIVSYPFTIQNNYQNFDLINNSIDITGSTQWLQGQPLEVFVDTKIMKYTADTAGDYKEDGVIDGCPATLRWSLVLIVYEEEKEENPKDYVDDRAKPHSIPALY